MYVMGAKRTLLTRQLKSDPIAFCRKFLGAAGKSMKPVEPSCMDNGDTGQFTQLLKVIRRAGSCRKQEMLVVMPIINVDDASDASDACNVGDVSNGASNEQC